MRPSTVNGYSKGMFLLIFVLLRVVTALFIIGLCRMARNELVEGESF
jgi:hypothetical protein